MSCIDQVIARKGSSNLCGKFPFSDENLPLVIKFATSDNRQMAAMRVRDFSSRQRISYVIMDEESLSRVPLTLADDLLTEITVLRKLGKRRMLGSWVLEHDARKGFLRPAQGHGIYLAPHVRGKGIYPNLLKLLSRHVPLASSGVSEDVTTSFAQSVWRKLGAKVRPLGYDERFSSPKDPKGLAYCLEPGTCK